MKKTTRVVLGSAMTMAMCASLIAGSTLALFSSTSDVNIAVTSGKVDVTATLGDPTLYTKMGSAAETEGWLGGSSATTDGHGLKLVNMTPGAGIRVPLKVTNASTIAIRYQLSFAYTQEGESAYSLFDVLEIETDPVIDLNKTDNTSGSSWLSAEAGAATLFGTSGGTVTLDIYLPDTVGNDYEDLTGNLLVTVKAVQGNAGICSGPTAASGHMYDDTHHCFFCGALDPLADFMGSDGTNYFTETEDSVTITGVPEDVTEITIPATANGKDVKLAEHAFTEQVSGDNYRNKTHLEKVVFGEGFTCDDLPKNVFTGCDTLQSVEFSSTMTEFSQDSSTKYFENCTNLQNVVFKGKVTYLAQRMFYGCTALQEIELPESLQEIPYAIFDGCIALDSVNVPDSVTKIASMAFCGCTSLKSIQIPGKVASIGGSAFKGCTQLASVTFAEDISLTSIESGTFQGCTALTQITLPDSLTEIIAGSSTTGAFAQSGLTSIVIPEGVTIVGAYAFAACADLQWVIIPSTVTKIGGPLFGAFESCDPVAYFQGSAEAWNSIGGTKPTDVKYFSETGADLDDLANYWRFENGLPKLWSES